MYTLCLSAQVGECSWNRKENRRGLRGHVVQGLHIPTSLSDSSYFLQMPVLFLYSCLEARSDPDTRCDPAGSDSLQRDFVVSQEALPRLGGKFRLCQTSTLIKAKPEHHVWLVELVMASESKVIKVLWLLIPSSGWSAKGNYVMGVIWLAEIWSVSVFRISIDDVPNKWELFNDYDYLWQFFSWGRDILAEIQQYITQMF